MSYLVFPQACVQCANIVGASFLIGGPPIFAAWGLGQALCFRLGGGAGVRGVALFHHGREELGERFYGVFSPQQRRSAAFTFGKSANGNDYSSKNKHALSLQPVACAHMRISIIWDVQNITSPSEAEKFLHHSRFAGGLVTQHDNITLEDNLTKAFDCVKSGYVLLDRRDLLENRGESQAELMVNALGQSPDKKKNTTWLSAACVGYAAITAFAHRAGVREGYLHAFAEPLVGMVQYQSLRQWRDESKNKENALWRPRWLEDKWGAFVLQQETLEFDDGM